MSRKPESALKPETAAALSALDSMWTSVDAALERIGVSTLTERPEKSFTIAEFAAKYGIPHRTAVDHLNKGVKAGELKRWNVRMPDSQGHVRPTQVYTVAK